MANVCCQVRVELTISLRNTKITKEKRHIAATTENFCGGAPGPFCILVLGSRATERGAAWAICPRTSGLRGLITEDFYRTRPGLV